MNKSEFEIRAIVAQVSQKELLDFYTMFRQVSGYPIDSPFIDGKYLKEHGMETLVGVRALLAPKLSKQSIDRICGVFEEFCQ